MPPGGDPLLACCWFPCSWDEAVTTVTTVTHIESCIVVLCCIYIMRVLNMCACKCDWNFTMKGWQYKMCGDLRTTTPLFGWYSLHDTVFLTEASPSIFWVHVLVPRLGWYWISWAWIHYYFQCVNLHIVLEIVGVLSGRSWQLILFGCTSNSCYRISWHSLNANSLKHTLNKCLNCKQTNTSQGSKSCTLFIVDSTSIFIYNICNMYINWMYDLNLITCLTYIYIYIVVINY